MSASTQRRRRRLACIAAAYVIMSPRRPPRWWQRQLFRGRDECSDQFRADLTASSLFTNFTRVCNEDFELLISLIGPTISKQDTNYRNAISVNDCLAVTLRFLATGDSYTSLMYLFKISKQSISKIVPKVCEALVNALAEYVKTPSNSQEWALVSTGFKNKWQFDQCLGALDGKHVVVQCPVDSGTEYFNYKGHYSIVLMALVDSNYSFLYVNVGCQGRISDGGVFKNCDLWNTTLKTSGNLPADKPLPGRVFAVPHVIVADDAFALHKHIIKPYPGHQQKGSKKRVFNYRVSRARRCSENAFGIMSSVFRVLRKPMLLEPEKATIITCACVYLHNFLRANKSANYYAPPGSVDYVLPDGTIVPGDWRNGESERGETFYPLPRIGRRASEHAKAIRDEYASYFISDEGSAPWQHDYD